MPMARNIVVNDNLNAKKSQKVISIEKLMRRAGIAPKLTANRAVPMIMTGAISAVVTILIWSVDTVLSAKKMRIAANKFIRCTRRCLFMFFIINTNSSFFNTALNRRLCANLKYR